MVSCILLIEYLHLRYYKLRNAHARAKVQCCAGAMRICMLIDNTYVRTYVLSMACCTAAVVSHNTTALTIADRKR